MSGEKLRRGGARLFAGKIDPKRARPNEGQLFGCLGGVISLYLTLKFGGSRPDFAAASYSSNESRKMGDEPHACRRVLLKQNRETN